MSFHAEESVKDSIDSAKPESVLETWNERDNPELTGIISFMSSLNKAMLSSDLIPQFSEELNALRLTLEDIPISQRQLQLSQWVRYIPLSNKIRLNIKLSALIQKNVDKLFSLIT
ncbi:hypothetical protein TNCV_4686761 [Trichonephila clavipes]|nr:hypothetical protein TNCV_4686761 [Trichonephila clavipes]